MKKRLVLASVVMGLALAAMQLKAGEKTIIAVASNFLKPAQQLARAYEEASGYKIEISAGSTGKLYAQIINGAPYAAFLAANAREPQRLEQEARIVAGTRFTYALGKLLLWSRDSELLKHQPEAVLREGRFQTIAIANPKTAPYGAAGEQVLQKLNPQRIGGWRLIRAENVGQAYQYTYTGAAELGFIAWSQLLTSSDPQMGSYWLVPEHLYNPIEQQAVLLKAGEGNPAATGFLEFLRSTTGKEMIRSFGYGVE
jgi:molybdate transport system substrate-binding protein